MQVLISTGKKGRKERKKEEKCAFFCSFSLLLKMSIEEAPLGIPLKQVLSAGEKEAREQGQWTWSAYSIEIHCHQGLCMEGRQFQK